MGDIHQWNVWHGSQEKYQNFDRLGGRFVSEFGMQAFPSVKTIEPYLPLGRDDPDRYPQSSTVDFHNKPRATSGASRCTWWRTCATRPTRSSTSSTARS